MITEMERVLRLMDVVIRYQTIRLEDNIPADSLDRFEVAATRRQRHQLRHLLLRLQLRSAPEAVEAEAADAERAGNW